MKMLLRKTVGSHHLMYEELNTILIEAEAMLNSRPLLSTDSTPDDGVPPLTPRHFIIGRPLRAPPLRVDLTTKETNLKRWNLVQRLSAEVWQRWHKDYLHEQRSRSKWKKSQPNLRIGDVVLLKELDQGRCDWPMARVLQTRSR